MVSTWVPACKNPPEIKKGQTELAEEGFVGEGPLMSRNAAD
jgi:hypothetical protein